MTDIRLPGLGPTAPLTPRSDAGGGRDANNGTQGFERELQRSTAADTAPGRPRGSEGRTDASGQAAGRQAQRSEQSARAGRDPQRSDGSPPASQGAGDEAAAAPAQQAAAGESDAARAEAADATDAAASAQPAADAAAPALPAAMLAAVNAAADIAGASAKAAADAEGGSAEDVPALALPQQTRTMKQTIDARGQASAAAATAAGQAPAAADETDTDAARALPAFNADLTRSPAKDRLLEDFERRFENSLARAAGSSTLGGGSPLAAAGLPPLVTAAGSAPTAAQAAIGAPVGSAAFGPELSHRVLLLAGQRVQSAELTVTPADLGPITVSIELRGQEAALQFAAGHAGTRAAIEDALPRLREMLAGQGLQLTQADVGDHAQRDARASGQGTADTGGSRFAGGDGRPAATAIGGSEAPAGTRRLGLIDIRV